jgi:hypothetical protein
MHAIDAVTAGALYSRPAAISGSPHPRISTSILQKCWTCQHSVRTATTQTPGLENQLGEGTIQRLHVRPFYTSSRALSKIEKARTVDILSATVEMPTLFLMRL